MRRAFLSIPLVLTLATVAPSDAAPPEPAPGWLAEAQRSIAEREYHARPDEEGRIQAPNRRHGLRTFFGPRGVRVVDRTAFGSPQLVALSLTGVGRGEEIRDVGEGSVHTDGARVEIRREGLVEWYENREDGLEQGFDLGERPPGEGPLVLAIAAEGAQVARRGDALRFATESGRMLRYAGLAAWDADGRDLGARMRVVAGDRFELVVVDADARYPVTVDPILTETFDTLLQSDQASAAFGVSVASAGDVNDDGYDDVIVGAPDYDAGEADEGAAFVFLGSPSGIADASPVSAQTQLEGDQTNAGLGSAVAGAGDVNGDGYDDVIVGAPGYSAGHSVEGAAFLFHGGPGGIPDADAGAAATRIESDQDFANLGFQVASAGDVNGDGFDDVPLGIPLLNANLLFEPGAVSVHHGSASGVVDGTPFSADVLIVGEFSVARFGDRVAPAGDVNGDGFDDILVAQRTYDVVVDDEGAAFIFHGSASGITGTVSTADTFIRGDQIDLFLGQDVAGAGDVNGDGYADVVIGSINLQGANRFGAAFVFHGGPGGIPLGTSADADAELEGDQHLGLFGDAVSGAGDVNGDGFADLLIGAHAYHAPEADEGAAFVFLGSATGIAGTGPASAHAHLENDQIDAQLGIGVAAAGDVDGDGFDDVIVGAPRGMATNEGLAFVYLGSAQGFQGSDPASAATRLESNQDDASFGFSVAAAGDVNGDGYGDVIVGADEYDAGEADEGAAFVFLGSAAGVADAVPVSAHAQLESNEIDAGMGFAVAGAGDVNGDGYDDVAVGAPFTDVSISNEGAVYLFHGSASGIADGNPSTADATLSGDQEASIFGRAVAGAGDVNGDGYADLVVGASLYDTVSSLNGAAWVFHGSASGLANAGPATADGSVEGNQGTAFLGESVASAGDVDDDGFSDVIVGAPRYDLGQNDEGAAFVFEGSASGIGAHTPTTADTTLEGDQVDAMFGRSVASAGDVNGDGFSDVVVGSFYDLGATTGAAFVFHGGFFGVDDAGTATADAQLDEGWVAAGAGDVNGDGYADVIVGRTSHADGETNEGGAFLHLGGPGGVPDGSPSTADAVFEGNASDTFLGSSVAGAGDVDGNGFADLLVGAERYDAGQTNEGGAFVFQGNRGDGGGAGAVQQQGFGTGSTLPQGGVAPGGIFDVATTARHPDGGGLVKLQVEICGTGTTFGDVACILEEQAGWTDATAGGGVPLVHSVGGLPVGRYRWRARVLHDRLGILESGITAPEPTGGPWRRPTAQAREGDVRVLPEPGAVGLLAGLLALQALRRHRLPPRARTR